MILNILTKDENIKEHKFPKPFIDKMFKTYSYRLYYYAEYPKDPVWCYVQLLGKLWIPR